MCNAGGGEGEDGKDDCAGELHGDACLKSALEGLKGMVFKKDFEIALKCALMVRLKAWMSSSFLSSLRGHAVTFMSLGLWCVHAEARANHGLHTGLAAALEVKQRRHRLVPPLTMTASFECASSWIAKGGVEACAAISKVVKPDGFNFRMNAD